MVAFMGHRGRRLSPALSGKPLVHPDNLEALGALLDNLWPVDTTPCFETALHTIDREDRKARARRALRKRANG